MGAKGTKNGQRKQYTLDDGQVVDVFVVAKRVNCSISLALARLNTSSDPDYIFMAKGTKIPNGHPYVQLERQRKLKNGNHGPIMKQKISYRNTAKHNKDGTIKSFYDPWMRLILKTI